jgi:hypothetical protein
MLTIWSGEKQLVVTRLEKKGRWILSSGGKVETNTPLPLHAGHQRLRVRVRSADENQPFEQEAWIDGDFPAGGALRLMIEFPADQIQLRLVQAL